MDKRKPSSTAVKWRANGCHLIARELKGLFGQEQKQQQHNQAFLVGLLFLPYCHLL
ncbi:conserved hypothetical protein [Ricinus communis]|uniref:Uncharacterized protein n=1 Tax=Ricinus communis TaxID=3988 RepID=B9RMS7_RICCO|nr:conserved hypothetical protein [Ricinus communis]